MLDNGSERNPEHAEAAQPTTLEAAFAAMDELMLRSAERVDGLQTEISALRKGVGGVAIHSEITVAEKTDAEPRSLVRKIANAALGFPRRLKEWYYERPGSMPSAFDIEIGSLDEEGRTQYWFIERDI